MENYLQAQHGDLHAGWEIQQARDLGLPGYDQPISPEYRQTIREKIDQGLESARQGRLVDGDAVFARIETSLLSLANRK